MFRRKTLFVFVLVCLVSAGLYSHGSGPENQTETKQQETGNEENSGTHEETTDEKKNTKDKKGIRGKAEIPSEAFKQILKKQESKSLLRVDQDYTCKGGRGEGFGYGYIDFMFLKKTSGNKYKPQKVQRFSFRKSSDKKGYPGITLTTGGSPFAQIRIPVLKNCQSESHQFQPGKKYAITYFDFGDGLRRVIYQFEIPEKEKIDFVPIGSKKEPEPYIYPVLVEDIRKTIPSKNIKFKNVTFSLRNAVSKEKDANGKRIRLETKFGLITDIYIKYKKNGKTYFAKWKKISKDGRYRIKWKVRSGEKFFGGDLQIYGEIRWIKGKEIPDGKRSGAQQLLMYKRDVQSKEIDMSEPLAYRYKSNGTVKKEVSIDEKMKKANNPVDNGRNIFLIKKTDGKEERSIRVLSTNAYKKDGEWYTVIEAKPGTYKLKQLRHILDEKFKWPPKKEK